MSAARVAVHRRSSGGEWPSPSLSRITACSPSAVDGVSGDAITPVCVEGKPVAAIVVGPTEGKHWDADDLRLLDAIAAFTGMALRNVEALESERQHADRYAEIARAKDQFLNLAAHELRGPMTVLMGYLSLLEDGAFGPLPAEFAGTFPLINMRLAEMEALVTAMLESSRLEENRLDLLLEDVDLLELVETAVGRAEVFAQADQHISLRAPDKSVTLHADRARLILAMVNLLTNALKYSVRHTDVRCVVTCDARSASVALEDEGIGIDEQDLPILFTRFGRIRRDPATSGIPGTGLGLYLARELVRAHHGDIAVVSKPGVGSTFTLTLPRA